MLLPSLLRAPSLATLPNVVHAFSRSLRTPEQHAAFATAAGFDGVPILRLKQVHGGAVRHAREALGAASPPHGDAFVAEAPGAVIAVAAADCVPVLLADGEAGIIAAVHAGWRGMRARVVLRALERMVDMGADPRSIRAAIGPAVQGSCYEVGPEVRLEFEQEFPDGASLFSGKRLDLVRAARAELARGGVGEERISVIALCTHCRGDLASYRREGEDRGTNLAAIALR